MYMHWIVYFTVINLIKEEVVNGEESQPISPPQSEAGSSVVLTTDTSISLEESSPLGSKKRKRKSTTSFNRKKSNRRSLLDCFSSSINPQKKIELKPKEDNEEGENEGGEFEVEKILDYVKQKVSLTLVSWYLW